MSTMQKNHPFIDVSDIVEDLCSPLFKEFGIRCFCHFRVNKNHQYTGVISDVNWAEEYLRKELQEYDIISFNQNEFEHDYLVWSKEHLHKRLQKVRKLAYEKDLSQGITLPVCNGDIHEFFGFAAENDNASINDLLIKNRKILVQFVFYYLYQIKVNKKLSENYSNWQELKDLKYKSISYCRDFFRDLEFLSDKFSAKRYYFNIFGKEVYFTDAQMKCLFLWLKKKTAKEIAQELKISFRTVQEHIEKIRNKIGAKSSNELYTTLSKNDYIKFYCDLYSKK